MKQVPLSDLIRRAGQALTSAYTKQEPAVTLPQAALLRALFQRGPMKGLELVRVMGMDRATAYELVKRMRTDNLVTGMRMESDQRAILLSITPAGRAALLKAQGAVSEAEARVLALVPRDARAAFRQGLQAIADGEI